MVTAQGLTQSPGCGSQELLQDSVLGLGRAVPSQPGGMGRAGRESQDSAQP